jgi:hypothetical protein
LGDVVGILELAHGKALAPVEGVALQAVERLTDDALKPGLAGWGHALMWPGVHDGRNCRPHAGLLTLV